MTDLCMYVVSRPERARRLYKQGRRTTGSEKRDKAPIDLFDHCQQAMKVGAPLGESWRVDTKNRDAGQWCVVGLGSRSREGLDPWVERDTVFGRYTAEIRMVRRRRL